VTTGEPFPHIPSLLHRAAPGFLTGYTLKMLFFGFLGFLALELGFFIFLASSAFRGTLQPLGPTYSMLCSDDRGTVSTYSRPVASRCSPRILLFYMNFYFIFYKILRFSGPFLDFKRDFSLWFDEGFFF
jgi:hypothetical protein